MTITEFLLARIAEDEETARDAALAVGGIGYGEERIENGKTWSHRYHEVVRPITETTDRHTIADTGGFIGLSVAPHIARHDPARVLAECEAKRRIVEDFIEGGNSEEEDNMLRWVAEVLAAIYGGHPDYREEWRP